MTYCAVLQGPTAGRGRHNHTVADVLRALGTAGPTVRILDAHTVPDALDACRQAVAEGAAALVAVGGDGTVHLAIQAVAGTMVPFGVVPAGTGNDFATEVGIPADPVAAAKAVSEALRAGRTRAVDLARLVGPDGYDRYFAAVLGAGFDAIVNERANAMRWPRGPLRYDLATYLELARLKPRQYTITVDGVAHELAAVLVAVGNSASYGGGMRICPEADNTDGLLDVVVAGPISRATLVRLKPRVYQGTHISHPKVISMRAKIVEIAADGITTYVDGERACPLPVTITAEPGALRLLQ
ncbi:MAG TPA: YegS/Rv2252/BmrU family lipid kinase [Micromonosporaceae bacterium]